MTVEGPDPLRLQMVQQSWIERWHLGRLLCRTSFDGVQRHQFVGGCDA